jgi:hypothetical protein
VAVYLATPAWIGRRFLGKVYSLDLQGKIEAVVVK